VRSASPGTGFPAFCGGVMPTETISGQRISVCQPFDQFRDQPLHTILAEADQVDKAASGEAVSIVHKPLAGKGAGGGVGDEAAHCHFIKALISDDGDDTGFGLVPQWPCLLPEIGLRGLAGAGFRQACAIERPVMADSDDADKAGESFKGSTRERSRMVEEIYDYAAPRINAAMSADTRMLLDQLHNILRDAIIETGGQVFSASAKQTA